MEGNVIMYNDSVQMHFATNIFPHRQRSLHILIPRPLSEHLADDNAPSFAALLTFQRASSHGGNVLLFTRSGIRSP